MSDGARLQRVSVVLPALNEAATLPGILRELAHACPHAEVLVIDDGSEDDTAAVAVRHGARVVRHPRRMGNGAAVKTGARKAGGDVLVFMDADGQHDPHDIPRLLARLGEGYDMVVGARGGRSQSRARWLANGLFNRLASLMTGFQVEDLTSGFRAVRATPFRKFLYLLPNGFSYPTTSTMAFFRSGYPVSYVPVSTRPREGKSHIRMMRDGTRFLIIIFKIGALFSPMRLFLPVSAGLFGLGLTHYAYTYLTSARFTNMSAMLLLASLFVFLMGLLSEQVSSLHYRSAEAEALGEGDAAAPIRIERAGDETGAMPARRLKR